MFGLSLKKEYYIEWSSSRAWSDGTSEPCRVAGVTPTLMPISAWSGRGVEGKVVRQMDRRCDEWMRGMGDNQLYDSDDTRSYPQQACSWWGTAKNCCLLDHLEGCWAEACFQHVPRKTDGKASGDALFQTPHCPESCKSMTWMMKRGATNRTRNNSKVTDRRVHFWRITPGSRTMQTYFPPNSLSFFVSNFLINFYWNIVAFQCCDIFCCTVKWISHIYT